MKHVQVLKWENGRKLLTVHGKNFSASCVTSFFVIFESQPHFKEKKKKSEDLEEQYQLSVCSLKKHQCFVQSFYTFDQVWFFFFLNPMCHLIWKKLLTFSENHSEKIITYRGLYKLFMSPRGKLSWYFPFFTCLWWDNQQQLLKQERVDQSLLPSEQSGFICCLGCRRIL